MSEAIFVKGLTKTYAGKTVVDHLDFSVKSGTVFGLLAFLGNWALTMFSTLSAGMLVGGVAKDTKQASVITSILYFPMLVFSGTTLPIEVMPKAMQKIVGVFPLTQGLTMMKNTFLGIGTESILLPICVMLGLTAVCTVLAVRFFRWE